MSTLFWGLLLSVFVWGGSPSWGFVGSADTLSASEFSAKLTDARSFFATGNQGSFIAGGKKVAYRVFRKPTNERNMVIFPGYGEGPAKYTETIYDFSQRGYNVFFLSHRGMGESQRMLANPQIIHIDDATQYFSDAVYFLDTVVKPQTEGQPVYLFTHSAGGLIGANAMARRPDFFTKAVLSAPLFELNLHGYSRTSAYLIGQFRSATSYAPGFSDYDPFKATFGEQTATSSPQRWKVTNQMYRNNPSLLVGGPSTGWIMAILAETTTAKITALAKRVRTPVLVLQAGDDTYVMPGGQDVFVKNAADATLIQFPHSRHEIHQERDVIRARAFVALFDFLEN
jgi:lysophospholipase